MDKSKLLKIGLSVIALACTAVSTVITNFNNDKQLEETVEKKVQEALNDRK